MNRVTAHILMRGHVQGIGFRRFVADIADELDVVGKVQNLSDGDVLIEATAERAVLDQLIQRVEQGNGYSIIEKVTIKWHEGGNPPEGFNVVQSHLW